MVSRISQWLYELLGWNYSLKGIYHAKLSQSNPAQGGAAALQQFTVQTFLGSSRISSQNISISLLRDFHWLPSVIIQLPAQLLLRLRQPVHVQGYFFDECRHSRNARKQLDTEKKMILGHFLGQACMSKFLLDCPVRLLSPRKILDIFKHFHTSNKLLYMVTQ